MTERVRRPSLRQKLLIAAGAILVVLVATVMLAPVVHSPGPKTSPALAPAERRSFTAVASASGALTRAGSSFVIWAPFSQSDDVRLRVGQPGIVTVDALPGQSFASKVTYIETSATQVNGVPEYFAESTLTTTDPRLRNGQTATVNVTVASVSYVLTVPTQALFSGASGALQGLQQGEQVVLAPG